MGLLKGWHVSTYKAHSSAGWSPGQLDDRRCSVQIELKTRPVWGCGRSLTHPWAVNRECLAKLPSPPAGLAWPCPCLRPDFYAWSTACFLWHGLIQFIRFLLLNLKSGLPHFPNITASWHLTHLPAIPPDLDDPPSWLPQWLVMSSVRIWPARTQVFRKPCQHSPGFWLQIDTQGFYYIGIGFSKWKIETLEGGHRLIFKM